MQIQYTHLIEPGKLHNISPTCTSVKPTHLSKAVCFQNPYDYRKLVGLIFLLNMSY